MKSGSGFHADQAKDPVPASPASATLGVPASVHYDIGLPVTFPQVLLLFARTCWFRAPPVQRMYKRPTDFLNDRKVSQQAISVFTNMIMRLAPRVRCAFQQWRRTIGGEHGVGTTCSKSSSHLLLHHLRANPVCGAVYQSNCQSDGLPARFLQNSIRQASRRTVDCIRPHLFRASAPSWRSDRKMEKPRPSQPVVGPISRACYSALTLITHRYT